MEEEREKKLILHFNDNNENTYKSILVVENVKHLKFHDKKMFGNEANVYAKIYKDDSITVLITAKYGDTTIKAKLHASTLFSDTVDLYINFNNQNYTAITKLTYEYFTVSYLAIKLYFEICCLFTCKQKIPFLNIFQNFTALTASLCKQFNTCFHICVINDNNFTINDTAANRSLYLNQNGTLKEDDIKLAISNNTRILIHSTDVQSVGQFLLDKYCVPFKLKNYLGNSTELASIFNNFGVCSVYALMPYLTYITNNLQWTNDNIAINFSSQYIMLNPAMRKHYLCYIVYRHFVDLILLIVDHTYSDLEFSKMLHLNEINLYTSDIKNDYLQRVGQNKIDGLFVVEPNDKASPIHGAGHAAIIIKNENNTFSLVDGNFLEPTFIYRIMNLNGILNLNITNTLIDPIYGPYQVTNIPITTTLYRFHFSDYSNELRGILNNILILPNGILDINNFIVDLHSYHDIFNNNNGYHFVVNITNQTYPNCNYLKEICCLREFNSESTKNYWRVTLIFTIYTYIIMLYSTNGNQIDLRNNTLLNNFFDGLFNYYYYLMLNDDTHNPNIIKNVGNMFKGGSNDVICDHSGSLYNVLSKLILIALFVIIIVIIILIINNMRNTVKNKPIR